MAEIIAVASVASTKHGNKQFTVWQRRKIAALEDMQAEEDETLTVFEKMKKSKRTNTLFSRLKYMAGKKHGI